MCARKARASVSPNAFDPTTVDGRPKLLDPSARPPVVDLVVDGPVVQKTSTVAVRPDDKQLFDALASWYHVRYGRKLTQWELFTLVLAAAIADRDGRFAGARETLLA